MYFLGHNEKESAAAFSRNSQKDEAANSRGRTIHVGQGRRSSQGAPRVRSTFNNGRFAVPQ
jgi:hypothetical protein